MDSQFSDIRKEYKKGKLTRNTISENPFEQFARWLNDALHCGENEPTAMIVATVSPDGRPSSICFSVWKAIRQQSFMRSFILE